jgi:predicted dehydrogenase
MNKIFKVGLIGCGHISETYFRAEKYFNNIKIIKCADINHGNAVRCAKTYKIQALTVNELLKDKEIEIVLNLTIPKAHYKLQSRHWLMVNTFILKNRWQLILRMEKIF